MFTMHRRITLVCALVLAAPASAQPRDFNPKISLILQGSYAAYSADAPAEMPGVVLGPETGLRPEGFSLAESELVIDANIDDRFRGWAAVALENEDGETVVALEEAYVQTLTLPAGLGLKFGRFFSGLGYQNSIHAHAWDFADLPLVYRGLLAGQLRDDGLQLRWVAPADVFVELGAEALRGQNFPAGGERREGIEAWTAFLRLGGDVGSGGAWRLGLSRYEGDADPRLHDEDAPAQFRGDVRLSVVDAVYKWAPQGNWRDVNVTVVGEYFRRDERGDWETFDDNGNATATSTYDGVQDGFYLQTAWQFMPRWRLGLRYDELRADNAVANPAAGTPLATLADGDTARRYTSMLDFSHSEFSRIRLQYNRDASRPAGERDDQIVLQYVMSLGSHPAHSF